jgi:hypothetical protein
MNHTKFENLAEFEELRFGDYLMRFLSTHYDEKH